VRADLLIANISDTRTYQALHALPVPQQFMNAIRSRESIHLKQFELTLRERNIGSRRELEILTPHDNHHSSRLMRTYHTHFGVPLGIAPGWWDDRRRNHKPVLPIYLRLDISNNLSRALSCLRLSGHNCLVQRCVMTEIEGIMSSGSVTNVTGTLFRMRNTFCWTVRMNILLEHLRTQHRQLVFPPDDCTFRSRRPPRWKNRPAE
jgi:hypothetical protein